MNSIHSKSKPHPLETSTTLSKAFYWWTLDILKKGYKKTFTVDDLYDPLKYNESSFLGSQLEKNWKVQLSRDKPSLLRALYYTFWKGYLETASFAFLEIIISVIIPLVLRLFLHSFSPESTSTFAETLSYALSLVVLDFLRHFLSSHMLITGFNVCGQIHTALSSLIYRKAIRLSKAALNETSSGNIVHLIAHEVTHFHYLVINSMNVLCMPLCALMIVVILYNICGFASFIGLFAVFAMSTIQVLIGNVSTKYRQKTAEKADKRIQLIDEVISGIQVMKMYTWEKLYSLKVKQARQIESQFAKKASTFRNAFWTLILFIPRLGMYSTLIAILQLGSGLASEKVFVIFAFLFLLNEKLLLTYKGIGDFNDCTLGAQKIESYLLLEEFPRSINDNLDEKIIYEYVNEGLELFKDNAAKENLIDDNTPNTVSITMDDLSIAWNRNPLKNVLERVNLKFEKGKLYMVIGTVGSGKTSLLSSVLREIKVTRGRVEIKGRISYAGQDTWIFGDTIRQNILFGEPFEYCRYDHIVKVCCLMEDFKQFSEGDRSIVGEKGIRLSGGQKARINLARALYRQADIYLLDNPLSAVDAHVSKKLFGECLQKFLRTKTRILATHQLQYLKDVDGIVLVDNGTTFFYENYNELLNYHSEYRNLVAIEETKISTKTMNIKSLTMNERHLSMSLQSMSEKYSARRLDDAIEYSPKTERAGSLIIKYFKAGSNLFFILIMFSLFFITQILICLNDFFVLVFAGAEEDRYRFNHAIQNINDTYQLQMEDNIYPTRIYIYIAITLVLSILIIGLIRSFIFDMLCWRSSKNLHNSAFEALINTKILFFHKNPSGRILNRFSKDVVIIDEALPRDLIDVLQIFSMVIGALIITCIIEPIFVIPATLILLLSYWVRKLFMESSITLSRLEGTVRALTFTHLNETVNGITTIRAFQAENILIQEFDKYQDLLFSAWHNFLACKFAFGFVLKLLSNVFILIITFCFVIFKEDLAFQAGEVGLAITQVFSMTGFITYASAVSADVTTHLKAVERLIEYAELPGECDYEPPNNGDKQSSHGTPAENWPDNGEIEFRNVTLRYSDEDDPVLKFLSFRIEPRQKIGIVGRTGAGKSSLISALFRLSDIDGLIKIDGIDTGSISLTALRSRISIIPQEPVLISGTLRQNLDPFDEYIDDDLWNVLEQVELKKTIALESDGLDFKVQDKGINYSVGQRQLICLARAILRKNRILVLDEATAHVDPHTDSLIQKTIRTKFKSSTVLTIAHRLNTIIDSDKVIVMNNGYLVEFDHPYKLLQNESGYFTKLVKEIGDTMFQQFFQFTKLSCKKM